MSELALIRVLRRALVPAGLIIALLAVSSASASPPKRFFGTGGLKYYDRTEFKRMASQGIGTYRALLCWACIEPQPGDRDWTGLDFLVGEASSAGVTILPMAYGTPQWINKNTMRPPIYTRNQRKPWAAFLRDAARRYGRGGDFWTLNPHLPRRPITQWQVWNEPNLPGYWGGKPNAKRYAALLKLSRRALRRGDPQARVVLAGIFGRLRSRKGVPLVRYLKRLYRVPGARRHFDVLAVHPYARTPRRVLRSVQAARRVMIGHRDGKTPIRVTEIGWTTGGEGWYKSPFRATLPQQAFRLRRSYRLLLRRRHRLRLRGVDWLSWRDLDGAYAGGWVFRMGLIYANGDGKPALAALSRIAKRTG